MTPHISIQTVKTKLRKVKTQPPNLNTLKQQKLKVSQNFCEPLTNF